MLKRPRPPANRADAAPIFVHPSDPAWDNARIDAEKAKMDKPEDHPVTRYHGGWTRYDLDAEATLEDGTVVTPSAYLSPDATHIRLKRLDVLEWYEVHPLWIKSITAAERPFAAFIRACVIGLQEVDGLKLDGHARLTEADLQKLHELGQAQTPPIDLVYDIGEAAYQASLPLTDAEKKP